MITVIPRLTVLKRPLDAKSNQRNVHATKPDHERKTSIQANSQKPEN
jgi:hypothetical protein